MRFPRPKTVTQQLRRVKLVGFDGNAQFIAFDEVPFDGIVVGAYYIAADVTDGHAPVDLINKGQDGSGDVVVGTLEIPAESPGLPLFVRSDLELSEPRVSAGDILVLGANSMAAGSVAVVEIRKS